MSSARPSSEKTTKSSLIAVKTDRFGVNLRALTLSTKAALSHLHKNFCVRAMIDLSSGSEIREETTKIAVIYNDNKQGKWISKDKRTTWTRLTVRIREWNNIETPWGKNSTTCCGNLYQNTNAAQRLETRKPLKDLATARKFERITAFQYLPFA